MFLEKVSLSGFRGIARLDMNFSSSTVLIGENTWGKSSFLRALWCILGNDEPYCFIEEDFRRELIDKEYVRQNEIMFVFTFRELFPGTCQRAHHLREFSEVWVRGKDDYHRIFYFIKGEIEKDGSISTHHGFLKENGSFINVKNAKFLVKKLICLNPLFRLRDSRIISQKNESENLVNLLNDKFSGYENLSNLSQENNFKQPLNLKPNSNITPQNLNQNSSDGTNGDYNDESKAKLEKGSTQNFNNQNYNNKNYTSQSCNSQSCKVVYEDHKKLTKKFEHQVISNAPILTISRKRGILPQDFVSNEDDDNLILNQTPSQTQSQIKSQNQSLTHPQNLTLKGEESSSFDHNLKENDTLNENTPLNENTTFAQKKWGKGRTTIKDLNVHDRLKSLFTKIVVQGGEEVSKEIIDDGVDALKLLLEHYFSVMPPFMKKSVGKKRTTLDMVSKPLSHANFGSLYTIFKHSNKRTIYVILALIAGSMLYEKGKRNIDKHAHPIVIFEDVESRLHPTMIHELWNILEIIPMQQIITTNSGDLLSLVPLTSIRRMTKRADTTVTNEVNIKGFTEEELRKIAFHIRINRPMSLFARTWILVEGETEIWLLNEFAAILGVDLMAEGIRLVEYAQCGVKPLTKLANHLGISWLLMADGDEAGTHYVENAKTNGNKENVILLPDRDIEHFLFNHGFERVYRECSNYINVKNVSTNKIIETAIKRFTKPGLALEIADEARRKGKRTIPILIQKLIARAMVSTR